MTTAVRAPIFTRSPVKIVMMILFIASFPGCVPPKVSVTAAPDFRPSAVRTIAVIPFQIVRTPQKAGWLPSDGVRTPESLRSQFALPSPEDPLSREARRPTVAVPPQAARLITQLVVSALERRSGIRVVAPDRVAQVVGAEAAASVSLTKEAIRQIGQQLGVEAVLVGRVRTYREREGTKWAATPAAVGFEVHVVDPKNGRILWSGEFYEEQKPLTEDFLGFLEHGGVFVTARELAESGVRKLMKEFPLGQVVS